MSWRLTVRHGSDVRRERFEDLDDALAELRRRAEAVQAEGRLEDVSMIRDYGHEIRVAARVELSGRGGIRRPEAGLDVMGDGKLVPYRGAIVKRPLEPADGDTPYDAIRAELAR